jgi:hypothetical protein
MTKGCVYADGKTFETKIHGTLKRVPFTNIPGGMGPFLLSSLITSDVEGRFGTGAVAQSAGV